MDLPQFYMEAGKIVLFPGNVDDLNRLDITSNASRGMEYSLMPMQGGRKFITGMLIPSPIELRELMQLQMGGLSAAKTSGLTSKLGLNKELDDAEAQAGEAFKMIEQLARQMFGQQATMDADIRMKARLLGANGLVHVQLYTKDGMYMGVPVRLENRQG